MKTMKSMQNLW